MNITAVTPARMVHAIGFRDRQRSCQRWSYPARIRLRRAADGYRAPPTPTAPRTRPRPGVSSSHLTPRWREMDSNFRFRVPCKGTYNRRLRLEAAVARLSAAAVNDISGPAAKASNRTPSSRPTRSRTKSSKSAGERPAKSYGIPTSYCKFGRPAEASTMEQAIRPSSASPPVRAP